MVKQVLTRPFEKLNQKPYPNYFVIALLKIVYNKLETEKRVKKKERSW